MGKRDLSKPLAPTFGDPVKKKKSKTKRRTVTKSTSASGVKTKDVVRVSRKGDKVTVKNKTKDPNAYGMGIKKTTKSKVKLSNRKGKDDYKYTSAKASTKSGRGKNSKGKSKSNTNSGAAQVVKNLPGEGMRNYKRPTKGKLKS